MLGVPFSSFPEEMDNFIFDVLSFQLTESSEYEFFANSLFSEVADREIFTLIGPA